MESPEKEKRAGEKERHKEKGTGEPAMFPWAVLPKLYIPDAACRCLSSVADLETRAEVEVK